MKKTILIAGAMIAASVGAAVAGVPKPTAVPEIEALAGVSAVAAVAGAVALIRERWKR